MDNQTVDVVAQAKMLMTYKAGIALHRYYMPAILLVGVIGNPMSFMVMIQKHNRRISCCVYIASLACTDFLLVVNCIYYWLVNGIVRNAGRLECKFIAWIWNTLAMSGVFLIVAMTVDRFLAVRFALKYHSVRTPKRALSIAISVIVLSSIYNSASFYTAGILADGSCSGTAIQDEFSKGYTIVSVILGSIGPFIVLVILNTLIGLAVHKRNKVHLASGSNDARDKSSEHNLIVMLFVITAALLVLTLPQFIRFILTAQMDYKSDPNTYALFMLIYHISNKMTLTNNCINFILYVISGRKFREDLRVLLKMKKSQRHESSRNENSMRTG